jgi:nucleotide-binding universal stress UspA family protein
MSVVCGTDFSGGAHHAVRVAALFARSFAERLVLVYVVEDDLVAGPVATPSSAAQARLDEIARPLRDAGLEVDARIEVGNSDEKLADVAEQLQASLVVVGFLGRRSSERWRAGSLPARLGRSTPAPVVVVRDAEPFEASARGERPLRVLVTVDFSLASDAAVGWLASLRGLGTCELTLFHAYDPVREWSRLGLPGRASVGGSADIEAILVRDLSARAADLISMERVSVRVVPSVDWTAETIACVAERERFDLVVVGGQRRRGLARIAHDSVSERLFSLAPASVVRVPIAASALLARPTPRMARLLAPTDLSDLANDAVRYAYSIADAGSTVHLLHVVEDAPAPSPLYAHYTPGRHLTEAERLEFERSAEVALRALVPEDAARRGIQTRTHVVRGGKPADAIRTFAEQIGADAICIGTHGRSGLSRILGGSVARELADRSPRPLLLIHPAVAD